MVDKAKIAKKDKRTKREKRDRERGQTKFKRDPGPFNSIQWLKK